MNDSSRGCSRATRSDNGTKADARAHRDRRLLFASCLVLLTLGACPGGQSSEKKESQPAAEPTAEPASGKAATKESPGTPDAENWQVSMYQDTREFPPHKSYYVENLFGDIRLRPSDDSNTVITGALQGEKEDAIKPLIELSESPERNEIKVRYPDPKGGPDLTPKQIGKRRVDLAVFIGKKSLDLRIKTRRGLLEVKSMPVPLVVESESAHMRLVVKNTLEVHNGYGPVEVFFKKPGDFHPPKITTVTGEIRVEFPERVDTRVVAETSGTVTSDFSTQITRESGAQHKKALIQLGKGGQDVSLSSQSGNISVLEKPSLRTVEITTTPEQP